MQLTDVLYGQYELEPILVELIRTKEMQRLKGIHQGGATIFANPDWNTTRFEHSVGTMLCMKMLGQPLDLQIHALLHDVSHTAFSHVVDHVYRLADENYHECIFQEVLKQSSIPRILEKYDLTHVLELESPLLEADCPHLTVDRLDYTLRDMVQYGFVELLEAHWFLTSLGVVDNQLVVSNLTQAEWFVATFYKQVFDLFLAKKNIWAYGKLTRILTKASQLAFINEDDFFLTDDALFEKVRQTEDDDLYAEIVELLSGKDEPFDAFVKERYVEPLIYRAGRLVNSKKLSRFIEAAHQEAFIRYEQTIKNTLIH